MDMNAPEHDTTSIIYTLGIEYSFLKMNLSLFKMKKHYLSAKPSHRGAFIKLHMSTLLEEHIWIQKNKLIYFNVFDKDPTYGHH